MKFNFNIKGLLKKIKRDADTDGVDTSDSGFFDKVGDFFNYEPEKERVLSQEDFKRAGDVYYASVSALYKISERFLWLILIIFLVFSMITNYKEITYDNFFYLLRDFSSVSDSQSTNNYQVLSYDSDSRQKFALYRGGIVSASPSTVSVFTAGGRRTLRSNNDYYSPNLVCCDKYVLVYDTAGSSFSLYNSFSKIYNEKLEGPIVDAVFDASGAFALATRQNDSKTVVYIYGKDMKVRAAITSNRFIFGMSQSDADSRFAALYYEANSGVGATSVCIYDTESSDSARVVGEVSFDGEFPIECSFLENGRLAVLTNRAVRVLDKNFKEIAKQSFGEASVSAFDVSRKGTTVAISNGIAKKVIAFDKNGDLLYNENINENVSDVGISEKCVFLRTISGVIRIDTQEKVSEFLPSDLGELLIYSEDTAIVCGEARAEYLVFGKKK